MRAFIIKRFALSYNVKLFGINFRYLRAVLPTIFFFCIAGVYTTSQEYQSVWDFRTLDFLLWLPVLICFWFGFNWFGAGYFRLFPIRYKDLQDWEQKHQYLMIPEMYTKESVSRPEDLQKFKRLYELKYKDPEDRFVNAFLGFAPYAIILLAVITFVIVS